jgi:hypothetical protein
MWVKWGLDQLLPLHSFAHGRTDSDLSLELCDLFLVHLVSDYQLFATSVVVDSRVREGIGIGIG